MSFKKNAAEHQKKFFPQNKRQIGASYKSERAQDHWLTEVSAKNGENFYEDYSIFEKVTKWRKNKTNTPEWFKDTLRSQHIPFNFFIPLLAERELAIKVLNGLFNLNITKIHKIKFEYPKTAKNPLNDRTSFDTFISYSTDNRKGFIGIEVKYTEGGYSPATKEFELINDKKSIYYQSTKKSGLYTNSGDEFLKKNAYRQIWRNHLLAFEFSRKNDFDQFISATFYLSGNTHFECAICDFKKFLTKKGKWSLRGITYERYFILLDKYAVKDRQRKWINYLKYRYML